MKDMQFNFELITPNPLMPYEPDNHLEYNFLLKVLQGKGVSQDVYERHFPPKKYEGLTAW